METDGLRWERQRRVSEVVYETVWTIRHEMAEDDWTWSMVRQKQTFHQNFIPLSQAREETTPDASATS